MPLNDKQKANLLKLLIIASVHQAKGGDLVPVKIVAIEQKPHAKLPRTDILAKVDGAIYDQFRAKLTSSTTLNALFRKRLMRAFEALGPIMEEMGDDPWGGSSPHPKDSTLAVLFP